MFICIAGQNSNTAYYVDGDRPSIVFEVDHKKNKKKTGEKGNSGNSCQNTNIIISSTPSSPPSISI